MVEVEEATVIEPHLPGESAQQQGLQRLSLGLSRKEILQAGPSQASSAGPFALTPLLPLAGSLVTPAWATLTCNICSSCGSPDGQMSGFASNRGEKREMRCLKRERETRDRDYAVCLPAISCWGRGHHSWQSPRIFPSPGSWFPSSCLWERQPRPSFSDVKGFGAGGMKGESGSH